MSPLGPKTDFSGMSAFWRKSDLRVRRQRPLSALAPALTQGVRLCLVQSLRDVGDQIRRVFDADRQPDRGVENAYFLADVSRNAGVGHARGQAGKRLGAAQAHRQLEDLQRVQEFEGGGLAAGNVERERGARAGALPREQTAGGGGRFVMSKVVDSSHFGV